MDQHEADTTLRAVVADLWPRLRGVDSLTGKVEPANESAWAFEFWTTRGDSKVHEFGLTLMDELLEAAPGGPAAAVGGLLLRQLERVPGLLC